MRKSGIGLVGLAALVALSVALVPGVASAAGNRKLVEGTLYDSTCAGTACELECPPPPHCGPITAGRASADIVCALRERIVACPLAASPRICLQGGPCGGAFPIYSGEGAVVKIRKRGSEAVLATLPVVEGHFKVRLGPGQYVAHPYLPEEPCWSGNGATFTVSAKNRGPIFVSFEVSNTCVAHPDTAK